MQDLLAKYFEGTSTQEELQSVEKWIKQNPVEFNQYKTILGSGPNFSYPENNNSFNLLRSIIAVENKKVALQPKKSLWKIAASLLLLAVFSFITFNYVSNTFMQDEYTVYSSQENLKEVTLKDGTKVWLKQNSKIEVSDAFNEEERKVILSGNAFFDVAQNPNKPFVIAASDIDVKVLGTSFSINQNNELIKVSVKTGKVNVSSELQETDLLPNEAVSYEKESKEFTLSTIIDKNHWAWTDKKLSFEETELKDVIAKIEETYKVKIGYNRSYDQVPFTGKFNNSNIEEIIKILNSSLDIKFSLLESSSSL
jgi:ferric-dicitrate binding protein FerR (iron transport regulator)